MTLTASQGGQQASGPGRHEQLPSLRQVFGDPDKLWESGPGGASQDVRMMDMPISPGDSLAVELTVDSAGRPSHSYGHIDGDRSGHHSHLGSSPPSGHDHAGPVRPISHSEWNHLGGSSMSRTKSGSGDDTSNEKKQKHADKEANRRNRMKDHYDAIRCIVPGCFPPPGSRPYSKEFVLKRTLVYLQFLDAQGALLPFHDPRGFSTRAHRGSPRR
ncbi:MAG: hypothetical protein M1823_004619 [Watsoniomyces obsoletus]|nr:MAG: hypothetical protein M1823_004619 [Watsoniomyces obsoletus]